MLLPLLDMDATFRNDPNANVIKCGSSAFTSPKQAEEFMKQLFKEDTGDTMFRASCECGTLVGNYYLGVVCDECNTPVTQPFGGDLTYTAWLEFQDYMPPMLHPTAYRYIKKWLGMYAKAPLLDQLLDASSTLPAEIEAAGFKPGFRAFHEQFDELMQFLLKEYKPLQRGAYKEKSRYIPEFLMKYRKILFVRHLPVLNQNLHVMTKSNTLSYNDTASPFILKAIYELANIDYNYNVGNKSEIALDRYTKDMYFAYLEYVDAIINTKLTKKPGFIRKYLLGSRCHFSFRAVIVPITEEHLSDEIHLPWRIGVTGHKLEIINFLINRNGYTSNEALYEYNKALFTYSELIDDILKTLIRECPAKGLICIVGRNPTLR